MAELLIACHIFILKEKIPFPPGKGTGAAAEDPATRNGNRINLRLTIQKDAFISGKRSRRKGERKNCMTVSDSAARECISRGATPIKGVTPLHMPIIIFYSYCRVRREKSALSAQGSGLVNPGAPWNPAKLPQTATCIINMYFNYSSH